MKPVFILFSFFTIAVSFSNQTNIPEMAAKKFTYLAIGDSYTIGESVAPAENFPNQAAQLLQKENSVTIEARIIAKTGWTTDELEAGIIAADKEEPLLPSYDFVSLLIGVNNQYRGRSVEEYKPEFEALLKKAIRFAGNKASQVVVLSIPDWGVTPFAEGRDRSQIAAEIEEYNKANKEIALQYKVHYLDITSWTRQASTDHSLLAADGLHPSGKEYYRWAASISKYLKSFFS
jgi:lysophospholipase L1-like esterase